MDLPVPLEGKTGCTVQIVADSISVHDRIRLTTMQLHYWRPIHAELMTHRVFSRNARSSRAVPVATLLKETPYFPQFQYNQPGMQAADVLDNDHMVQAHAVWQRMIDACRNGCAELHDIGVHKQWANRPLEWFGWIDVLVTSTDWANWFELRDHGDAAPEIHELAHLMGEALEDNNLNVAELWPGDWHLPYILPEEPGSSEELKLLSTARCARLSYKPFDGNADYEKEQERYNKLVGSRPVHASPAEHQATPDYKFDIDLGKGQFIRTWAQPTKHGNFTGWIQNRKEIPHEAVMDPHHEGINF